MLSKLNMLRNIFNMGLDQFVFDNFEDANDLQNEKFYWRKHYELDDHMTFLPRYDEYFHLKKVTLETIAALEEDVNNSYGEEEEDNIFWEKINDYKEQDLKFIKWAKKHLADGGVVIYHSN